MNHAFIYSHGQVILENDKLFIRKIKPSLTVSEVLLVIFPLTIIFRFALYLFENESPKRNMGLVISGFLALFFSIELGYKFYKVLFKKSFAQRIPLQDIITWNMVDDPNKLEVHLLLKLCSGRERKISFRKLENEHQRLTDMLLQYHSFPKFA